MEIENVNIYDLVPSQILEIISKLKDALVIIKERKETVSKVAHFEKENQCCPYCNGNNCIKYGHKNKIQNYYCNDCERKFNDLTGTVFANTHLTYEQIDIFLDCFVNKISIRKTAEKMEVNKNTVYLLRCKILDSFNSIRNKTTLSGEIEADEIYRCINLKGTPKNKMPRASKPRTSRGTTTRGISSHKVCIMGAIDENDNMFLQISGNGPLTSEMVKNILTPKINDVKKLVTDCKSSYEEEANKNHWNLKQVKSKCYTDSEGNNLANINSLHSGLTSFLAPFRGVSTKHLQGYLEWYIFDKYLNYSFEYKKQNRQVLKIAVTNSTIVTSLNMCNNFSGLNFKEIYADYNYTPPTLI